jgi:N-acetylmuramoyl-L-alanine amidase
LPNLRTTTLALAALLLVMPSALYAASWSVQMDGQKYPLEARQIDGVEYLKVSDLARAFGGRFQMDRRSGNFVYELQGRRIVLSATEGLASLDAKILTFSHPNRLMEGELWVVSQFVQDAVAPIFDRPIERQGTRFLVGGPAPLYVKFRASRDAGGTRVVLEFSRRVTYEVDSDSRGVRLRTLDAPLKDVLLPAKMDGTEIKRVFFEEGPEGVGGVFAMEAGPTYNGVRTSELDRPFRIVLDFDRSGGTQFPVTGPQPVAPPAFQPPPAARGIRTVILDPGHGGEELGAEGPSGLQEKSVVLDVANRTARLLRDQLGLEVLLTRERDQDIPLDERAAIANNRKGDLFVSIHANASVRSSASGAETYFLAYQTDDADAAGVAARENQAGRPPKTTRPATDGLEMVLWEMAQAEYLTESFLLAETIQQEFNDALGSRDRGVRQAPFRVLMGAAMPAVLVEVAFITNRKEEALLRQADYREQIALSLVASIARYKETYEARIGLQVIPAPRRLGGGGS